MEEKRKGFKFRPTWLMGEKEKGFKFHPAWLCVIGILCLWAGLSEQLSNVTANHILEEVGAAIIISATLVFSLETRHYREYFSEMFKSQITELMMDDKYLDGLKRERQESLKQELDRKLFFKDRLSDRDELWDFLNDELSKLIDGYYYSEFNVSINCSIEKLPDNVTEIIKKNMVRNMSIVNPTKHKQSIDIPIDISLEPIKGIPDKDLLKIIKFSYKKIDDKNQIIEEKNITEDLKKFLIPKHQCNDNCTNYCVNFLAENGIDLEANTNLFIDYELETIVPITDNRYVHRITKPCKRYRTNFILNNNDYQINGWGFAFDDTRRMKMVRQSSNFSIAFTDWILPGDGTIFSMSKKINKSEEV